MTRSSPKAQLSFDSPSGRSFLRVRLTRRFVRNIVIVLGATAVVALAAFWGAKKSVAAPGDAIGSVYALPAGPWGRLTAQPILVEAPKSLLSPNYRIGDNRWYFPADNAAEVDAFLGSCGLDPAQISTVRQTLQPVSSRPGLMAATPPPELIRGLAPDARSALYRKLALVPENFAQAQPFRIADLYLDDWLDAESLPPELIAEVKSLLWRRGNVLFFSDYNLVADSIASPTLKVKLLGHLTRKASLVIKLDVPKGGDIEPLVAYWGAGGREDEVRPLLAAADEGRGGELDISKLLPTFARRRLYQFPTEAEVAPGTHRGPDCNWSAFNFFNADAIDESVRQQEGLQKVMDEKYVLVEGDPRFGDIILLTHPDGTTLHSAVYIADGIVFTKNGTALAAPFIFSTMENMLAFYPSEEKISQLYIRRKDL